jgi:DNA-binding LacI/PurR family transcriptional regulator
VGRRSVDALISEIQSGEHRHQPVSVGTELVVRSSTAPPRPSGG